MLQRLIDDVRVGMGNSLRLTGLAAATAVALFIATSFFCAAAFVFVLLREGAVAACLAGGAVFLVVALLAGGCYMYKKRQDRLRLEQAAKEAAKDAKSAASTLLSDPAALAIGLQLVRLVGVRRLVPLLAIGGIALGLLASQRDRRGTSPAE
jgi:archaellum biogenesis protein FlaJ (TadC family)